jgi:ferrochelatase
VTIDAVLLIAFGGPTRPEEIRPFLDNVTRGRRIPPERLEAVVHHYETIGGCSPLNEITFRQATALRTTLAAKSLPVYVGMKNWEPYLATTLEQMADAGVRRALGLILSPHASEASRERYVEAVDAGRAALGPRAPEIAYAPTWHVHPRFIEAAAEHARHALAEIPAPRRDAAALIFTAHSIPVSMAAAAPYERELAASAAAVARELGRDAFTVAYQSRSGNPREPWLEPDINALLESAAARGVRDVVVVPIGFVCDHVEVLYDLDVEARATAARLGLGFARARTVNDHPAFIAMLADVVDRSMT